MDRQTFDRLMIDHLAAGQRFAVRLSGGDVAGAEDLLHDAIVRAAQRCDGFRGESKFTTWLFAIIVNIWRDRVRRRQHEPIVESEQVDAISSEPIDLAQWAEVGQVVIERIAQLPDRQREVLILIAFEEMSSAQAAAVLGISEQNVRVNLFHARARLKEELADYLGESNRERRRSTTR